MERNFNRFVALCAVAGGVGALSGAASAQDIDFTPDSAGHNTCPPFGNCPPQDWVTTEYIGFGVDFTQLQGKPGVGVFSDPPDEFGGVNAQGNLDLLTDVWGRIVRVGSTDQAFTDYVEIEMGFLDTPTDGLLEVYDKDFNLLASRQSIDGKGPDDRELAIIDLQGNRSIAYFKVSGIDTYGVRHIWLNTPIVPTPGSVALLGLGGIAAGRRRR